MKLTYDPNVITLSHSPFKKTENPSPRERVRVREVILSRIPYRNAEFSHQFSTT